MLKVTIELVPQGNEAAKRHLYSVEISNTNVDMTGNFGQYLATMIGEGIPDEKPLAIKLRKFNRDQGAAKLTSRILSRFFRKYKALLSMPGTETPAQAPDNGPNPIPPVAHQEAVSPLSEEVTQPQATDVIPALEVLATLEGIAPAAPTAPATPLAHVPVLPAPAMIPTPDTPEVINAPQEAVTPPEPAITPAVAVAAVKKRGGLRTDVYSNSDDRDSGSRPTTIELVDEEEYGN